jgi:hypothetical protein
MLGSISRSLNVFLSLQSRTSSSAGPKQEIASRKRCRGAPSTPKSATALLSTATLGSIVSLQTTHAAPAEERAVCRDAFLHTIERYRRENLKRPTAIASNGQVERPNQAETHPDSAVSAARQVCAATEAGAVVSSEHGLAGAQLAGCIGDLYAARRSIQ